MDGAEIVSALRTRGPDGLAAAYDTYADRLFAYCIAMLRDRDAAGDAVHDTFLVAYERVDQLRDPGKLRPWLYAIARNECLRILRARKREAELDEAVAVSDETVDLDTGLRAEELRRLVWAAADGLNDSEREVLELAVRHDLPMPEVARTLGVTDKHAHALLSRARQQLERALGALIVARTGRQDCPTLDGYLSGWDGALTILLRKRIARHIESCQTCAGRKRRDVNASAMLATIPLLAAPLVLRDQVLDDVALVSRRSEVGERAGRFDRDGFPLPLDGGLRRAGLRPAPALGALVIAALVVGGTLFAELRPGGAVTPDPTPSAVPTVVVTGTPSGSTPSRAAPTPPASPTDNPAPEPSRPSTDPPPAPQPTRVATPGTPQPTEPLPTDPSFTIAPADPTGERTVTLPPRTPDPTIDPPIIVDIAPPPPPPTR